MIKTHTECKRITPRGTQPIRPRHYRHTHRIIKTTSSYQRCVCGSFIISQNKVNSSLYQKFIILVISLFKWVLSLSTGGVFPIDAIGMRRNGSWGLISILPGKRFGKFYSNLYGGAFGLSSFLWTPGLAGSNATSPDSAALSLTSDAGLLWYGLMDGVPTATVRLIDKLVTNTSGYTLQIISTGAPRLSWAAGGTNVLATSAVIPTFNSSFLGLAATLDLDNGAGNAVVKFYTWNGSTWSLLDTVLKAVTTLTDGTAVLTIGDLCGAKTHRVQICNNALINGTGIVFDADFTTKTEGAASFVESSSNAATVTINGYARITPLWAAAPIVSLNDNVDRTSYSTASWTPLPNKLYIIGVACWCASTSVAPTGSGNTITWNRTDVYRADQQVYWFWGYSGSSPTAGAFTASFGSTTQVSCQIHVVLVDGADLTGTTPIVQNRWNYVSSSSPYTESFDSTPKASSRCFAGILLMNVNTAMSPRTNWTETLDASQTSPTGRFQVQMRLDASETSFSSSGWASNPYITATGIEVRAAHLPFYISSGIDGDFNASKISVGSDLG